MKKIPQYRPKKSGAKKFQLRDRRTKYNDPKWTKYRFRFLHYNPKCYCCGQDAKHVDHIVSAVEHPEMFEELTNHLPLCVSCHSTVTARFDARKPQDLEGKMQWIEGQRKIRSLKSRVKVLPVYDKGK